MWPAYGTRPGWRVSYVNAGGRLRAWEPAFADDPQYRRALCQAVMFVSEARGSDVSSVTLDVLRRLLTRGDRPPVDPALEHAILRLAGLSRHVAPSPVRGDLSPRLGVAAPVPAPEEIEAAACWRERFELDDDALDHLGRPLVHPARERPWLTDQLPRIAGPCAGQWLAAQAWLDALVDARLEPGGSRRVDFLIAPPSRGPLVVEIDGLQHQIAVEVDRTRDDALRSAGIAVVRLAGEALDGVTGTDEIAKHIPTYPAEPRPEAKVLVWAAPVAARIVRSILEALEAGWLAGRAWHLRLEEPTGIGIEAIRTGAGLLAALDAVWNTDRKSVV